MIRLPAIRYDGQTSAQQSVELSFDGAGKVYVSGQSIDDCYDTATIRSHPRVGKLRTQLVFPDGVLCEVADHPELETAMRLLPKRSFQDIVHTIENNRLAILSALVLTVSILLIIIQYGIPAGAKYVAFKIPLEMERNMGKEALAFIDKTICKPSKLDRKRKEQLKARFLHALAKMEPAQVQIHFRDCEKMGANAFALPSGIIVFTDDMVNLAKNDQELIGVLAHEVGHVLNRHIMRQILHNSVTGLLLVLLTGDISSASSFAAALPTFLVQAKFSRDFETESDGYAAWFLQSQNIPPRHLANLLKRLAEQNDEKESGISGFLSTHPLTEERVKKLNLQGGKRAK